MANGGPSAWPLNVHLPPEPTSGELGAPGPFPPVADRAVRGLIGGQEWPFPQVTLKGRLEGQGRPLRRDQR